MSENVKELLSQAQDAYTDQDYPKTIELSREVLSQTIAQGQEGELAADDVLDAVQAGQLLAQTLLESGDPEQALAAAKQASKMRDLADQMGAPVGRELNASISLTLARAAMDFNPEEAYHEARYALKVAGLMFRDEDSLETLVIYSEAGWVYLQAAQQMEHDRILEKALAKGMRIRRNIQKRQQEQERYNSPFVVYLIGVISLEIARIAAELNPAVHYAKDAYAIFSYLEDNTGDDLSSEIELAADLLPAAIELIDED